MASRVVERLYTFEEYLELERSSPVRHEFVHGMRFAMAGGSARHNNIVRNLIVRFYEAEQGTSCTTYFNDVLLRISPRAAYYPDVMVGCDPSDDDEYVKTRPCVLVEVLSPSTEDTDRRDKLLGYLGLPSLRAYLLVHQDRPTVERHWRDEAGAWQFEAVSSEGLVRVPCIDLELPLEQVFTGVSLPES